MIQLISRSLFQVKLDSVHSVFERFLALGATIQEPSLKSLANCHVNEISHFI